MKSFTPSANIIRAFGAMIFALVALPVGYCAELPSLTVSHMTCEGLDTPQLVDTPAPRFSWRLNSSTRGVQQTAYQLRVTELGADGKSIGVPQESARVDSDQSQWVELPGFVAKPKARYQWQVRVWDNQKNDSDWSPAANFETSLLGGAWEADWLSDGKVVARIATTGGKGIRKKGGAAKSAPPPARNFRKKFTLSDAPVRAKLYLSAFGVVEPWVNGQKVTEDLFIPGWPEYSKRNFYVAYDVTKQLQAGPNAVGLVLGEGWYSSTLILGKQYGPTPMVSGWFEIVDQAGKTTVVATDSSWQWANGPIVENGIYPGETFDARREDAGWSKAAGCAWNWQPVKVEAKPTVAMIARYSPPARRIQEMKPVSRKEIRPGVFIYDMGQNMVGWVKLKAEAATGQQIKIRFTEMLDADGSLYTKNLRSAKATALYIAKGDGVETWEPRFSYFGFRYVELSGVTTPADDAITGVVVHANLPRTGQFECSNPMLNKLYSNTLWGQKGNFLEVPTDCPQRDERMGWTGDAQVFCNTANYNMACGPFYRQWMASVRDGYLDRGGYGSIAPGANMFKVGAAGWADAGVIVPWMTWVHTGDRRILEDNFATIQKWIALLETQAPDGIRRMDIKTGYGDWLAPGSKSNQGSTPYPLLATAYYAQSTRLAADIATVLGKPDIAARYRALLEKIKTAFRREFVTDDGQISSDEQTAYLMALDFDLVPPELRSKMITNLARTIAAKDNHLATGFLGTPLIAPVLSDVGLSDLAYNVVLQETYPGWLYSVKNGATTVWERWDSWTPEKGFSKGDNAAMNSFNHYAYGAVVGWFYDTIAGLKPDVSAPGWKHFKIAPTPGGKLTHAKASLETAYGIASSDWRIVNGRFELAVKIPPNTQARVSLPAANIESITEAGSELGKLREASGVRAENGRVSFNLTSGTYQFVVKPAGKK
jgi:alpha-L-rhamnosidase